MQNNDKQIEKQRYDDRARSILKTKSNGFEVDTNKGALSIPPVLRTPYLKYELLIQEYVQQHHFVLEIGSGTGMHTYSLIKTGAKIIASDISVKSLEYIKKRFGDKVMIQVADMESLPFQSNLFDVVASAGSLSYGESSLVDSEIIRVLRPGGMFICVDSLNHNPIYRVNRWIHYLRNERTKSTLKNMPTRKRIESIAVNFEKVSVFYFGSISWLLGILSPILNQKTLAKLSDFVDGVFRIKKSAFKFVLIGYNNKVR